MISKLTNSEIGSRHWFNTLLGNIKQIGQFMEQNGLTEDQEKNWGKQLAEYSQELLDNFEIINSTEDMLENIIDEFSKKLAKLRK